MEENKKNLLEEIRSPLNVIMLSLTILSIMSSIMFYMNSIKAKKISYHIGEPSSLIFDSKNSSQVIKLLEKDSIMILDNVYLLIGEFWNSGDLPIQKSDIRKKLSLELGGAKRILDYKIIKQNEASVANFKLEKSRPNSLNIDWDFFDPNFGFSFQVMYIGDIESEFKVAGNIIGIKEFNHYQFNKTNVGSNWIYFGIILIYAVAFLMLLFMFLKRIRKKRIDIFFLIAVFTLLLYVIYHFGSKIILFNELPSELF